MHTRLSLSILDHLPVSIARWWLLKRMRVAAIRSLSTSWPCCVKGLGVRSGFILRYVIKRVVVKRWIFSFLFWMSVALMLSSVTSCSILIPICDLAYTAQNKAVNTTNQDTGRRFNARVGMPSCPVDAPAFIFAIAWCTS